MTDSRSLALVRDLLALPAECAWVEFKENNVEPDMIGVRISALANAARLSGQHFGYMLWGVADKDHAVVGTSFEPTVQKAKSQPLEFYLAQRLNPSVEFSFKEIAHPDGRLVLLEIPAAITRQSNLIALPMSELPVLPQDWLIIPNGRRLFGQSCSPTHGKVASQPSS